MEKNCKLQNQENQQEKHQCGANSCDLGDSCRYYAHSPKNPNDSFETIQEHAEAVASAAKKLADVFGFGDLGAMAGLLHDIGKYQSTFQRRIRGHACSIEHSQCGAKEALSILTPNKASPIDIFNREILSYIIAGHHSGLPDIGTDADNAFMPTLKGRLARPTEDYAAFNSEINIDKPTKIWTQDYMCYDTDERAFAYSVLTRLLFSVLVDSDSLQTERFYNGKERNHSYDSFEKLKLRLDEYLSELPSFNSIIMQRRCEIQKACVQKSTSSRGLFSLTVPTGGGKTLSSMVFAINHLLSNGLRRIIYVVPYTSIIEQIAKVFKSVFGEHNVLEHHSNFTFEDVDESSSDFTPQFLATENWDAPIIITTNVQFFESFFSNKRGSCRKLHNVTNSVIVFDEAQMLPITLLEPCIKLVDILTRSFGCTALLMSATCPDYQKYLCKGALITEINNDFAQHYMDFRRVQSKYLGKITDEELANLIDFNSQTLIIVNSRQHAKRMYNTICNIEKASTCEVYHLSTLMTPMHRSQTLDEIRDILLGGSPLVVISTCLVECGVDLDFATVYRSLAGVDSIVQAGGRCNREGKRSNAVVYVFESDVDPQSGDISKYKSLAREIVRNPQGGDLFDLSNINKYFSELLAYSEKLTDSKKILELFKIERREFYLHFNFATCAELFRYIENDGKFEVIVNLDEHSQSLVDMLIQGRGSIRGVLRKLTQYTISIYKSEYKQLQKEGKVQIVCDYLSVVNASCYDNKLGLMSSVGCTSDDLLVI